jgi:signal transduction histidine kinase
MSLLQRHRWFFAAGAMTAAFAVVSLTAHPSHGLTAFADLFGLFLMLAGAGIMVSNAISRPGAERTFWGLMAFGFSLWAFNQGAWTYCEVFRHIEVPDPYFADAVLFFHLVPMIAAIGWRPDIARKQAKFQLSTVNFLMLVVWWIFLYAFIVFPHQYVVLNVDAYDSSFTPLYELEIVLLLVTLLLAMFAAKGAWKKLYLHLLVAAGVYSAGAPWLDRAVTRHIYYSGSIYDVPLMFTIGWMVATALSARNGELKDEVPSPAYESRKQLTPQLAMLAMLTLPLLGLWTLLADHSPAPSRVFRLFAVLGVMLILGGFVFLRQYLQDQALIHLLEESRCGYETQQRLQGQLVQKEKLTSLGALVAGAAREIDHPLEAVMECSEQLWSEQKLSAEQDAMVRKIVNQAQRTRKLVFDLLSFAQQSPGEKVLVDVGVLLQRGAQMLEAQQRGRRVRIEVVIEPGFPRVTGNANQLFQAFVEIIENSMDAMQNLSGGSLKITAQRQGSEAVLQFADTGPGIREPQRVFDPFYTTKAVGQGTGLGLSAVYGVIQDHDGQITCQNNPDGGALFVLRFPACTDLALAAEAAKA